MKGFQERRVGEDQNKIADTRRESIPSISPKTILASRLRIQADER
jgi:hypothetical protein